MQYIKLQYLLTLLFFLIMTVFMPSLLLASGSDPFATIQSNLDSTYNSVIKIVQVVGAIGLVIYGGYSIWAGHFDKVKFIIIIFGLIIVGCAKIIANFVIGWGS